ncbi:hypothetical protein BDV95DRAFT_488877 [Massariosphaeria phaeospora]|uniref:Uncharacterized protein n=1 Tax=Massariosphaeria phaeospora TaxID=100035 RepID=A0A7C8I965_9PLEO|nr:hypothetical protein BDV95DRAFT_488877 [Massariosphaeria phaeospora]
MRFSLLVLVATAAVSLGDFILYTELPIPLSEVPTDPASAASFTSSVFINGLIAWGSYTNSLGEPYKASELPSRPPFKASNFSVPAAVTDPNTVVTITTNEAPPWYTPLPTRDKQFKEEQVQQQFSIVRDVIARRRTTTGSTGGALPTAMVGLRVELGIAAAAAAAAFL